MNTEKIFRLYQTIFEKSETRNSIYAAYRITIGDVKKSERAAVSAQAGRFEYVRADENGKADGCAELYGREILRPMLESIDKKIYDYTNDLIEAYLLGVTDVYPDGKAAAKITGDERLEKFDIVKKKAGAFVRMLHKFYASLTETGSGVIGRKSAGGVTLHGTKEGEFLTMELHRYDANKNSSVESRKVVYMKDFLKSFRYLQNIIVIGRDCAVTDKEMYFEILPSVAESNEIEISRLMRERGAYVMYVTGVGRYESPTGEITDLVPKVKHKNFDAYETLKYYLNDGMREQGVKFSSLREAKTVLESIEAHKEYILDVNVVLYSTKYSDGQAWERCVGQVLIVDGEVKNTYLPDFSELEFAEASAAEALIERLQYEHELREIQKDMKASVKSDREIKRIFRNTEKAERQYKEMELTNANTGEKVTAGV